MDRLMESERVVYPIINIVIHNYKYSNSQLKLEVVIKISCLVKNFRT